MLSKLTYYHSESTVASQEFQEVHRTPENIKGNLLLSLPFNTSHYDNKTMNSVVYLILFLMHTNV